MLLMIFFLIVCARFVVQIFGPPLTVCLQVFIVPDLALGAQLRAQKIWWLGEEDQLAFVADRHVNSCVLGLG